jgi:hypothetical protein
MDTLHKGDNDDDGDNNNNNPYERMCTAGVTMVPFILRSNTETTLNNMQL